MGTKYRKDTEATRWNHRPKGAVALNPLFEWPPKFLPIFSGTLHIGWQHRPQPLLLFYQLLLISRFCHL